MARACTVLIVDDEEGFRENVSEYLEMEGFKVLAAASGHSAVGLAQQQSVDVAVLDLMMPGMDGIELMSELRRIDPLTQVLIMTAQGSVDTAVDAMRRGALDYLAKPARMDELAAVVARACESGRLARQNRAYRHAQRRHRRGVAEEVIARSESMRSIVRQAEALGGMTMPVLIQGETGTGKEVVAELIHSSSDRADMPLTVLNCAALPESLVDSELFGHEKGTYTGASDARVGMIEVADGGTLFLDEIGDMPLEVQARLLRFLESGAFRRVGGRVERVVDARILAATNRDLTEAASKGAFRLDLYHRLRVYELAIPPLRQRREDVIPLADSALRAVAEGCAQELSLAPAARESLLAYDWPGNVRELLHTIERAAFTAALAGCTDIQPAHLKLPSGQEVPMVLAAVLQRARNDHVRAVLALVNGNRGEAASMLGVSERQMYRLISELDIPQR